VRDQHGRRASPRSRAGSCSGRPPPWCA